MKDFKALGENVKASKNLEWFRVSEDDLYSGTALDVSLECTEFTCRCPVTNQPDWAKIYIDYGAKDRIVESKSVKLYMETFREVGIFHEHLARVILKDFVEVLRPHWCTVTVMFNTRGGIAITAKASYKAPLTVDANWELTCRKAGRVAPVTVDVAPAPWYDAFTNTPEPVEEETANDPHYTQLRWWPT